MKKAVSEKEENATARGREEKLLGDGLPKQQTGNSIRRSRRGRGRRRSLEIRLTKLQEDLDACHSGHKRCSERSKRFQDSHQKKTQDLQDCNEKRTQCRAELQQCRRDREQDSSATTRTTKKKKEDATGEGGSQPEDAGDITQDDDDDLGATSPNVHDGDPCSNYDSVVTVTPALAKTFCNSVLRDDTAFVLDGDITCSNGGPGTVGGPTLSTRTCLDCRGHTIRGASGGKDDGDDAPALYGVVIPSGVVEARVHNCNFRDVLCGVRMNGDRNAVSNIKTTNTQAGVINVGRRNRLHCSLSMFDEYGLYSDYGSVVVSGGLITNSHFDGMNIQSNAAVSCTQIHEFGYWGIAIYGHGTQRKIRDTIIHRRRGLNGNNGLHFGLSGGTTNLTNVVSCSSLENPADPRSSATDVFIEPMNTETIHTENLRCDNHRVVNRSPFVTEPFCDGGPCPRPPPSTSDSDSSHSSAFLVSLPDSCSSVCPRGRGTYVP